MSRGAYVFGFIELVVLIAALGFPAWRIRAVLAPNWVRTPARLAEAVIGLSLFVVVAELLGVVGLLEEIPLLLAAVLTAVGAEALYGRRAAGARLNEAGDVSSNALGVAGAMVGAL